MHTYVYPFYMEDKLLIALIETDNDACLSETDSI
jgi:hypothetical protein